MTKTAKFLTLLALLLTAATGAWADEVTTVYNDGVFSGFTATDGTGHSNPGEEYPNLVDNNKATKFYSGENTVFVEFHSSGAFVPTGYILTTGNDTQTYSKRNPKNWTIKAKASEGDEWTTIAEVTNDTKLEAKNQTSYEFDITGVSTAYRYFRFDATSEQYFQLGELQFKGNVPTDIAFGTISGVEASYNLSDLPSIMPSVTTAGGSTLNFGTDYTVTLNGESVASLPISISATGDYTLTVTGTGSYSGEKSVSFMVLGDLSGTGTEADPYIIGSTAHWESFAQSVKGGTDYSGKYVKLTQDIAVSSMANGAFSGTFDGNGKTITAHIEVNSDGDPMALFRNLTSGTIKNLTLAGSISGPRHTAALVQYISGTGNTIYGCTVTANVNCTDTHMGGILGHGNTSDATIENCVFSGLLSGGSVRAIGVFWGWGDDGGTRLVKNCLYLMPGGQSTTYLDIVRINGGSITVTDCYKTTSAGSHGIQVYATVPDGDISQKLTLVDGNTYYRLCTVSDVASFYSKDGDNAVDVTPVVKNGEGTALTLGTDYTATLNAVEVSTFPMHPAVGDHTLVLTGKGNYAGSKTLTFNVRLKLDGDGTEANPYTIASNDDWEKFTASVSGGYNYSGQYVKLTQDIIPTSMVGASESNPFSGTFLGDGHTMTVNITGTSEQGTAPFHYIKDATIRQLTVAGSIASTTNHAAGLVGFAAGTNLIEGCTVTATIQQSSDYAGGFVGHGTNSTTTIKDCIFAGIIIGVDGSRSNIGGFWGWSTSGKPTLQNCLEKGIYTNIASMHPMGLQGGTGTITNGYYLNPQVGEPENACTVSGALQVYTAAPADEMTQQKKLLDGVTYYVPATVEGLKEFYRYTGSAIEPEPVVVWEGTTLTKGTDYDVAYADNTDKGTASVIVTGKGSYTGKKTVNFLIDDYLELTSSTTELKDNCVYKLTSDINISTRINVSGAATLILGDGHTLTAPKGIEVNTTNQLTIDGETENTGKLLINDCSIQKSGIGGYFVGTIIINGGTIDVKGGIHAAGIAGDYHSLGGSVTINGGIVNATGGRNGAGIGGGHNDWGGAYGQCPTLTINGGQVTAIGGVDAPGIGPGYPYSDACYNPSGDVKLGWTNADDFISVTGNGADYGFGQRIISLGFVSGKGFRIGDSSGDIATTENIKGVASLKLVPANDVLTLSDNADNTDAIADTDNSVKDVVLSGRTLYKDGGWNTICLPFSLTVSGSVLDGSAVKTLASTEYDSTTGTLTLNFSDATTIEAGKPYIVKWDSGSGADLVSPVFSGVTISKATANVTTTSVDFIGTYAPLAIGSEGDNTLLYMGADNKLYYPSGAMQIGSCRAYFQLKGGITAGDPTSLSPISNFVLNFDGEDNGETTGIATTNSANDTNSDGAWYTLDGRQLSGQPAQRGVYVNNGKKVVIK